MADSPTAFISYSWDDEAHKEWVLTLASRLVENGVSVKLDRWHVLPGKSLTEFMERSLQDCSFTLIICTPNYSRRSQNRMGGVGYEQQIISGQIASGIDRGKFIPVVRCGSFDAGAKDCALPPHFLGIHALDFRGDYREEVFEDLLRAIFKAPRLTPPSLGRVPVFANPVSPKSRRLATIENDGWHLSSGVASNELHPDTFHIPSEEERMSVKVTDVVKLPFEFSVEDEETPISGERMWVEVVGLNGPYFVGTLRNQPATFAYVNPDDPEDYFIDEEAPLTFGSEVVFLPEHIISIMTGDEADAAEAAFNARERS